MNKLVSIILFIFLNLNLVSQNILCGNDFKDSDIETYLNKSRKIIESKSGFSNHYTVRIFCHILRKSDGSEGYNNTEVLNAIAILENVFSPHQICFSLKGIDYIDSDYFSDVRLARLDTILKKNKNEDAIDIYFAPKNSPYDRGYSVGFTFPVLPGSQSYYINDAVILGGTFVGISLFGSHILSHEIAHVLGLLHVFEDAICEEFVNGTNCSVCGDLICDTDASPNINLDINLVDDATCQYIGSLTDPNGDLYNPDPRNIMDYGFLNCINEFSDGQGVKMRGFLATEPSLQKLIVPNDTIIAYSTENSLNKFVGVNNNMYVAHTDVQSNTSLIYQAGNIIELRNGFKTTLGADFTARVIENCNFLDGPYNSAKTNEDKYLHNSNINRFNLYPNPFEDYINLEFFLKNNEKFNIDIYDIQGRIIQSELVIGIKGLNKRSFKIKTEDKVLFFKINLYDSHYIKKIIKN